MTRPCPVDPQRFEHVLVPSKFGNGKVWKITLRNGLDTEIEVTKERINEVSHFGRDTKQISSRY